MSDETVNVRYMVDDVDDADRVLHQPPRLQPAHERRARLRRRPPRQPAAAAQRPHELGRKTDARRPPPRPRGLEPHPPDRRRPRGRGRPAARRRRELPQRHRHRPRAASRSCSTTPPATRSSSSSPRAERPPRVTAAEQAAETTRCRPSLLTVAREWGRIGCIGFGGPPTHVALRRELCVERKRWLDAREFADAVAANRPCRARASGVIPSCSRYRPARRRSRASGRSATSSKSASSPTQAARFSCCVC